MSIRELPTNIMLSIVSYLITTCKPILQSHPLLRAIYDFALEVHEALTESLSSKAETTVARLTKKATELDVLHDALNRGLHGFLGVVAELTQDPQKKDIILETRERLFPLGLRVNVLSYSAEAAEARRLDNQLKDPGIQAQLKDLIIQFDAQRMTAYDAAKRIVKVGQELEDTLAELTKHKAEQKAGTSKNPKPTSEREARRMFLQLIRTLQEGTSIGLKKHPEKSIIVWQKLNEELAKASSSHSGTKTDEDKKGHTNPSTDSTPRSTTENTASPS